MKKPKKSPDNRLNGGREFIKYMNVALRMIVVILAGVFGGIKLDEYFNNEHAVFTLVFSILSVIGAMYIIIREISSR